MPRVVLVAVCLAVAGASTTLAVPQVYDGFDYANDGSPVAGQSGGYGWAGPWEETGAGEGNQFTLTQSETSLDLPVLPFNPVGDHIIATGPGGANNNAIIRDLANPYNLGATQTFYASYLMSKSDTNPKSNNNMEFNLASSGNLTLRLGSTSGDKFWLGATSNTFGAIEFDSAYFVVLKMEANAAGSDIASVSVYDASESIPLAEPGSFDATYAFTSSATITSARFWIGSNAIGRFDELRFGRSWEDVTSANPNYLLGDFDSQDGVNVNDFHILRANLFTGATYEQGDIDFSGTVDLNDFARFRQIYLDQGVLLGDLILTAVPEPSAGVVLLVILCALGASIRRDWFM